MKKDFLKFSPNVALNTIPLIDAEINHLNAQYRLIAERIKYLNGMKRGMIEGLYSTNLSKHTPAEDTPFIKLINQVFVNQQRLLSINELSKLLPYKETYIRNVLRRRSAYILSYSEKYFVSIYGPAEFFDIETQLPLKQFMPSYEVRETHRKLYNHPDTNTKKAKDRGFKLY